MNTYLVVVRNDYYYLVGPFADNKTATLWAEERENNPSLDGRWIVCQLNNPDQAPMLYPPDMSIITQ